MILGQLICAAAFVIGVLYRTYLREFLKAVVTQRPELSDATFRSPCSNVGQSCGLFVGGSIKRMVKSFLLAAAALVIFGTAEAKWEFHEEIDAMTDENKKSAVVLNDSGHKLSIYRIPETGQVWANFQISSQSTDQLDPELPPKLRIDKNEPIDLANTRTTDEFLRRYEVGAAFDWKPKWVNFLIWHGQYEEGLSKILIQLMTGENAVVRYYLFTGGYKDTRFSLANAATSISQALMIPSIVDIEQQKALAAYKSLYRDEAVRCDQVSKKDDCAPFCLRAQYMCNATLDECVQKSDRDPEKLVACLGE